MDSGTLAHTDSLHGRYEPSLAHEDKTEWLSDLRSRLKESGSYLVYRVDGIEHVVPLGEGNILHIGRAMTADIRLEDISVSRRHAILSHRFDGWHVLDDRSLNGIRVNGNILREGVLLHDGDEIFIGHVRFWFVTI